MNSRPNSNNNTVNVNVICQNGSVLFLVNILFLSLKHLLRMGVAKWQLRRFSISQHEAQMCNFRIIRLMLF